MSDSTPGGIVEVSDVSSVRVMPNCRAISKIGWSVMLKFGVIQLAGRVLGSNVILTSMPARRLPVLNVLNCGKISITGYSPRAGAGYIYRSPNGAKILG